jgi:hypothetical protein
MAPLSFCIVLTLFCPAIVVVKGYAKQNVLQTRLKCYTSTVYNIDVSLISLAIVKRHIASSPFESDPLDIAFPVSIVGGVERKSITTIPVSKKGISPTQIISVSSTSNRITLKGTWGFLYIKCYYICF